ncbi:MAG: PIG-L family deacetylase [Nitrospirae bacterium]|nr:PIG-L family deacetylase [Nitrospirota bacterium]
MINNESELYPFVTSDFSDRDCLVLAPHPDDESIGCGGAIIKHIKKGRRVRVVFLTSGDKGDFHGVFGKHYKDVRRECTLKALAALGVDEHEFWDFEDREVAREADKSYLKLKRLVETFRPGLIYVTSPYEVHPDHKATALMGWKVFREMKVPVAFYEVLMPLYPNTLVDISSEMQQKESAIRHYSTELYYNDYIYRVEGLNRFRTATLSPETKYAEAFFLLNGKLRDKDMSYMLLRHFFEPVPFWKRFFK